MKVQIIAETDRRYNKRGEIKTTVCGNIVELMEIQHRTEGCSIKRLGGKYYCLASEFDEETGELAEGAEIREMEIKENRGQNIKGMRSSMKALRDLINCNVENPSCCRWVTLTYKENMTDTVKLRQDHEAFMKRLRRYCKKKGFPDFEYIVAVEPQGRGAWHTHELWIFDREAPFLVNEDIAKLWGHGFVTVKKLENIDNIGAYLTAYLCDVSAEEASELGLDISGFDIKLVQDEVNGQKVEKRYIKGARLGLYPAGMNFYRSSRGVKRPSVEWLDRWSAKEKVKGGALTFTKTMRIEDGEFSNDIHYEYYNMLRKR